MILRDPACSHCIAFLHDLARNSKKWCECARLCAIPSVHALHTRSHGPFHPGTDTVLRTYMLSVSNMQHILHVHCTPYQHTQHALSVCGLLQYVSRNISRFHTVAQLKNSVNISVPLLFYGHSPLRALSHVC